MPQVLPCPASVRNPRLSPASAPSPASSPGGLGPGIFRAAVSRSPRDHVDWPVRQLLRRRARCGEHVCYSFHRAPKDEIRLDLVIHLVIVARPQPRNHGTRQNARSPDCRHPLVRHRSGHGQRPMIQAPPATPPAMLPRARSTAVTTPSPFCSAGERAFARLDHERTRPSRPLPPRGIAFRFAPAIVPRRSGERAPGLDADMVQAAIRRASIS